MGDDPPFLTVGTEVSAKYKGAFCEAKVRKVVRSVKCKVTFKLGLGTISITDDQIRGGTLRVGSVCEVKHPEKKEFVEAIINKIQDCSQYTVVFDDGDITTLRRTALCLKSGRHFAESETLDQLPLTHPEHFSNPVIGGRKGRRSRQAQEESSDEEDPPKKGKKKEEKEADIGKVVCVELGDKKKQKDNWFPGLVVAPTAQDAVRIRVKDEYLVRSFKDGRYFTVPKKEATEFTREIGNKVDNHTLKAAVEKALQYLDQDELPPHWDRDLLFGLDESSMNTDSDGALDSDSSDDEPREEKDHFVAQLYKFMDDRGTPINRGPTIGSKDVDLYKLFKVVHKRGGYNRVTNHNQWKTISQKLGFGHGNSSVTNLVKQSYKKFLHSFEDFYRKLGCTMVNHPRGHRSRHRTGRSLIRDRDRATPTNIAKEKEKKEEKTASTEKSSTSETAEKESSEKKEEDEKKDDEKKEEAKPRESAKKSKTRDDKTDTQSKQKGKDAVDSSQPEAEEKEIRSRSKKDIKTAETKVPKLLENVVKEETVITPEEMPVKGSEHSEETKTRESKSKGRESKPKERAKVCDKSKNKDDKVKVSEEEKNEDTKKKVEKKPVLEEEEKNTRATKIKDETKSKKESSRENPRETRTPVRDSSNRTPVRLRKEEETASAAITATATAAAVAANLKKRGRKRKEMDEKVKAEESLGHLASNVAVCVGDKLKVYYGPTHESKVTYEAKVLDIEEDGSECMYLVHYTGWNTRYDEWIKRGRIADNLSWTPSRAKRQRQQQSQHKTSRPSHGKRGRPSVSNRGHDGMPNPPRSTTPSSVTSSSSRTKSPATRSTPRTGRSAGDSASPGHDFRRRTRRMSGHTDISVATDSESDEYESEAEPESEMAQTRSRTTEQRRSVSSSASATSASVPRQTDKHEQSPVTSGPTPKEEPVRRAAPVRKKTSAGGKKKDSPAGAAAPTTAPPPLPPPPPPPPPTLPPAASLSTSLLSHTTVASTSTATSCAADLLACTDDNEDEKPVVEVSICEQQQQTAEKRRSRRGKRSPAASSQSPPQRSKIAVDLKMEMKTEMSVGTESEDDSTQPKGRDFDLNQIRSELKGIEKAVKSPLELNPVQSHGDDDDDDDDDDEIGIEVKVEVKDDVKMEVQELKTNVRAACAEPALFADIEDDEEEDETFKVKREEIAKDLLATVTMSPIATAASSLLEEEEDVYEFKEPEPFEFEVRKRESPDSKGLTRRPGSAASRILELSSSAPDALPAISNLSPPTSSLSLTRPPDTKSPRKRLIRTPPKDSMAFEGGKKIRRTPQKKLSSEINKNIVETKEALCISNSSPPKIEHPISEQVTLSSLIPSSSSLHKTSMEHTIEKVSSLDIAPSISASLAVRGKQTLGVRTLIVTSPVSAPSIDESPVSPPLLTLPDDGGDEDDDADDDDDDDGEEEEGIISARKSPELGPLRSMLSESHDDDYDDDHEDRLVISESDDMVTETAEPLFSYQQDDHEDLFPTLVTSSAVVTAVGTDASKADDPPCLSPMAAPSGIFHGFSSPAREFSETSMGVNIGSNTNSIISHGHSALHQQQQKSSQLLQLQIQSEPQEQLRHMQLDQLSQPWRRTHSPLLQGQQTKPQEQLQLPKLQKEPPQVSKQLKDQYPQAQQLQESVHLSKIQQLQQEQPSSVKQLPERLLSPKPQQEQSHSPKQLQEIPQFLKQLQEIPPLLKQQQELPHLPKHQDTSLVPKQQQEVPSIPRQQEIPILSKEEMLLLSRQQELLHPKLQSEQLPLPKQQQDQSSFPQPQQDQSPLPKLQKQQEQLAVPKLQNQPSSPIQVQEQSFSPKHVQEQIVLPKQFHDQPALPKHQEQLSFLKQPQEHVTIPKQSQEKSSLAKLTQDIHLLVKQPIEKSLLANQAQEKMLVVKQPQEKPSLVKQPQEKSSVVKPPQEKSLLVKPPQEKSLLVKPPQEKPSLVNPPTEKCSLVKPPQEKPSLVKPPQEKPSLVKPPQEKPLLVKPPQEKSLLVKPLQEKPSLVKPPQEKPSLVKPPQEKPSLVKPPQEKPSLVKPPQEKPLLVKAPQEKPSLVKPPQENPLLVKPPQEKPSLVKPPQETPLLVKPPQEKPSLVKQSQETPSLVKPPQEKPSLVKLPQEKPSLVKPPQEKHSLMKHPQEKPSLVKLPQEKPSLVKLPQERPSLVKLPPEKPSLVKQPQEKPSLVKQAQEKPASLKLLQEKSSLSKQSQEKHLLIKHTQEKPILVNKIQEKPTIIKQSLEKSAMSKQLQEKASLIKSVQEKFPTTKQTLDQLISLTKHSQEQIPVAKQSQELSVTKQMQEPVFIKQSQDPNIQKQLKETSRFLKQQQESQIPKESMQSQLLKQQEESSQANQNQEMLPKQQLEQQDLLNTQQEPSLLAKQIPEQPQQMAKKQELPQLGKQHATLKQPLTPQTHHQFLQQRPQEMEKSPPPSQRCFGSSPARSPSSTAGSPSEHGEDTIKELLKQQDDDDEDDSINAAIQRAIDQSIMEEDDETSGDMELFCGKQTLLQTDSNIPKASTIPTVSPQKGSPSSNASPRHSSGSNTPARKRVARVTMTSAFLDSEDSVADSSDDEGQRLIIDPMDDDGSSQPHSCSSPMSASELQLRISEADAENQPQDTEDDDADFEAPVDELRTEDEETFEGASIVMAHNASPAPIPDDSSSASEVVTAVPIVTEEETMESDDLPRITPVSEKHDEDSLEEESSSQLRLNTEDTAIEVTNECETSSPVMTPVIVKVDLDDTSKIAEGEIISGGVVVLDASASELSSAHTNEQILSSVCHTPATTVVTATIVSSQSNLNPQSPTTNIVCETSAPSAASSILALAAVPLEVEAAEMRQESRSDDADSQLLGSLLCQETIPGSPAQAGEGGSDEPLPESKVLVLEMPFASVPASSCDATGSTMSLPVPMSVPLSIPVVTPATTSPTTATIADIASEEIQTVAVATAPVSASVTDNLPVTATAGPAQHHLAIPSPGVSKLNSSEAAPVLENTPPTTPDSTLSTMSGSPREEHGDMSPGMDNESSKSHRDSFEMDLDSCPEGTKVGHFSEDDSLLNVEVSNSCDSRLQGLKLVPKKSGLDIDKENETSPKKRRRSHKRSESESNKRVRCSSGRSVRPTGGTGSDSDDTSENSALGCTPMASSESTLSSKSPRPSKYNFYVELDPELDGSQRIALLQQKLQELRKTYMNVKAELACIDRRRKKLRRREREVEKASKQEVACS